MHFHSRAGIAGSWSRTSVKFPKGIPTSSIGCCPHTTLGTASPLPTPLWQGDRSAREVDVFPCVQWPSGSPPIWRLFQLFGSHF